MRLTVAGEQGTDFNYNEGEPHRSSETYSERSTADPQRNELHEGDQRNTPSGTKGH